MNLGELMERGRPIEPLAMAEGELKDRIREMLVGELMLQQAPEEIADDTPLFDPEGLGLDSVDALQLVVAIEKQFGLRISDAEVAKRVMHSVSTIAEAVKSDLPSGDRRLP